MNNAWYDFKIGKRVDRYQVNRLKSFPFPSKWTNYFEKLLQSWKNVIFLKFSDTIRRWYLKNALLFRLKIYNNCKLSKELCFHKLSLKRCQLLSRKIKKTTGSIRNSDFSKFFVQISANISKTRMFLDMQFFENVKRYCDYDVKKSHKQYMSSF